jgi:hypothetical protein
MNRNDDVHLNRRPYRGTYVFECIRNMCVGGLAVGVLYGGLLRGSKPLHHGIWMSLNLSVSGSLFFSAQELLAWQRQVDDVLNTTFAAAFSSYAVVAANSRYRASAPRLCLISTFTCTLAHVAWLHARKRHFEPTLADRRYCDDDCDDDEDGAMMMQVPWHKRIPRWLPIRNIDNKEIEELSKRSTPTGFVNTVFDEQDEQDRKQS